MPIQVGQVFLKLGPHNHTDRSVGSNCRFQVKQDRTSSGYWLGTWLCRSDSGGGVADSSLSNPQDYRRVS